MKVHVNALHRFKVILRTKFKYDNEQKAITPKVWCLELWFLCTALLLNEIYLPMIFQVSSLNMFRVMLRTKFKNEQRAKLQKNEALSYGSCVLHFSSMRSIYLWSFMLMPCIVLKLCSGQKRDGRTDGHTDWQTDRQTSRFNTICHRSGA